MNLLAYVLFAHTIEVVGHPSGSAVAAVDVPAGIMDYVYPRLAFNSVGDWRPSADGAVLTPDGEITFLDPYSGDVTWFHFRHDGDHSYISVWIADPTEVVGGGPMAFPDGAVVVDPEHTATHACTVHHRREFLHGKWYLDGVEHEPTVADILEGEMFC